MGEQGARAEAALRPVACGERVVRRLALLVLVRPQIGWQQRRSWQEVVRQSVEPNAVGCGLSDLHACLGREAVVEDEDGVVEARVEPSPQVAQPVEQLGDVHVLVVDDVVHRGAVEPRPRHGAATILDVAARPPEGREALASVLVAHAWRRPCAADVGADVGSCGPRARQVVAQAGQRILHLKGPLHAPPQCQCRVHVLGRRKLREVRRLDVVAAAPPQPPVLREALPPQPLADRRRGRGLAPAPTGQRAQAEPSGVELRTLLQEERAAGQGRAEPAGAPSLECPDMPSALGQQRRGQVRGREDRVQVLDEQQYKATRHKHLLDLRQRALRQEVIGH
mmetsp:Transcript_388/g.1695  ORF Transcript_388/g.1695 Transcript_388/m.1695 type:complete len:337 (+) Transcript_388:744-1754(+)